MALVALGVFSLWWAGFVGLAVVLVVGGLFGPLVAVPRRRLEGAEAKLAGAWVQVFGAWCGLAFFIMALVTWSYGNGMTSLHDNVAYFVLGVAVFLGFLGPGVGGAVGTLALVVYVHLGAKREQRHLATGH